MLSLNSQYALGLDIGQSTVKAVLLSQQGKRVRFVGKRILDCRAEGLLGAAELRAHLPGWLGAAGGGCCCGARVLWGGRGAVGRGDARAHVSARRSGRARTHSGRLGTRGGPAG